MSRTPRGLGAVALGLVLTACATGTAPEDGDERDTGSFDPEADLEGGLQIMGFGLSDEVAEVRHARAEESMPGVEVTLVEGDLDIQQFLSAMAAGDPPDLVYANRDQIGTFASRGAIVPLDDCLAGEGADTDVLRPAAVEQVTFDDRMWGMPEFNQVQITMANADLLDAAGLAIDDVDGSDWDGVRRAAGAMVEREGGDLRVIGFDSKLPEFLPLWAMANGTSLLSEDGRTAQLDDDAVVEALEFAAGLYEDQGGFGAVKAYRDSADFFGAGNQFAAGSLGAMPMEQWYVNILADVSPDAPVAFGSFRDRAGEPLAFASGSAWAIPAGSANPEAACRYLRVMTETDSWLAAAEERHRVREENDQIFTGLLTGNVEADEEIRERYVPTDAPEPWATAIDAVYASNDRTFSFPANPADAEFTTAWQDAANRVLNGQAEPRESLERAQEEAQAALDEAWAAWDQQD